MTRTAARSLASITPQSIVNTPPNPMTNMGGAQAAKAAASAHIVVGAPNPSPAGAPVPLVASAASAAASAPPQMLQHQSDPRPSTQQFTFTEKGSPNAAWRRNFDTHKVVKMLRARGLGEAEAEGIVEAIALGMADMESHVGESTVSRAQFSDRVFNYRIDFITLKNELAILERNDFAELRKEHNRITKLIDETRNAYLERFTNIEKRQEMDRAAVSGEIVNLKTDLIRIGLGTLTSIAALGLALFRIYI